MFLSAFGAGKPLTAAPSGDPFWANVFFIQNFNALQAGQIYSSNISSQKAGNTAQLQCTGTQMLQCKSIPSISGNSMASYWAAAPYGTSPWMPSFSGVSEFTAEVSVYKNSQYAFFQNEESTLLAMSSDSSNTDGRIYTDGLTYYVTDTNVSSVNTGISVIYDAWVDFAVSMSSSGVLRYFINGTLVGSFTGYVFSATSFRSGISSAYAGDSRGIDLFYDELRLTNVCRYTSSYTPSHPFPLS